MAIPATVYVIDDDESFLRAVTRLLRAKGFAVDAMTTLNEFRSRLPLAAPACVLSDVVLDGESGLAVPGILRGAGDSTPVIFLTASDQPELIARASRAGAAPCMPKPIEAADLLAALIAVLNDHPETT